MTDEKLVAKIRGECERLLKTYPSSSMLRGGAEDAIEKLLAFLGSLSGTTDEPGAHERAEE